MVGIKRGFVAHPVAELAAQSGYCGTPGGIVVEIAQYQRVFRQSRDCFADIRHGVKHNTVIAVIQSEAFRRKKVDEALKHVAPGITLCDVSYVLGRVRPLIEGIAKFKTMCIILKTYGIVVFAVKSVIDLHTPPVCRAS